jgi:hypothetical protein
MRYVNLDDIELPEGWLERAKQAKQAVASGNDPNDHATVWRELKNSLGGLFHDKCWFCETPVTRSDNAVDHFRPKGRVREALRPHPGYRWLAFDQSNFRYSCTFCNSRRKDTEGGTIGGKADRFPLMDEASRAYTEEAVCNENPKLLDPCELDDWRLLGCKIENGKPCPTSQDREEIGRAEASIEIYHLHHEPTCKQRLSAARSLLRDVEEAKALHLAGTSRAALKLNFKRILGAIDDRKPYSGEMRFLLGAERHSDHPWIQELLET